MANTAPDISALVSALPAGTIPSQYAPLVQMLGSMLSEDVEDDDDVPDERVLARRLERLRQKVRAQQQRLTSARRVIRAYRNQNRLLARAHGACECWGGNPACTTCGGQGCARWTTPDDALLRDLLGEAVIAPSNDHEAVDPKASNETQDQERGN